MSRRQPAACGGDGGAVSAGGAALPVGAAARLRLARAWLGCSAPASAGSASRHCGSAGVSRPASPRRAVFGRAGAREVRVVWQLASVGRASFGSGGLASRSPAAAEQLAGPLGAARCGRRGRGLPLPRRPRLLGLGRARQLRQIGGQRRRAFAAVGVVLAQEAREADWPWLLARPCGPLWQPAPVQSEANSCGRRLGAEVLAAGAAAGSPAQAPAADPSSRARPTRAARSTEASAGSDASFPTTTRPPCARSRLAAEPTNPLINP